MKVRLFCVVGLIASLALLLALMPGGAFGGSIAAGRPLRWVKTYDQPDFVYFSHRPHVVAGVNCEVCHGDVSQMTVVRQAYRINMGFCLHCHRQQEPEKVERLISCATCHK
jgi:hypothetical protein